MADCSCRYELDLCSDCDGLRVMSLDRLARVSGVTITYTTDKAAARTPAAVNPGRMPEPCISGQGVNGRG